MRIVMLGPPGSGKGTQGDLIEEKYGFAKVSSGDLLREEVKAGTALGKEAEVCMRRGELVSDVLVLDMIQERISRPDCQTGYVLDGFPRNISQAKMLEKAVPSAHEIVLDIRLSDFSLVERLSARRICSNCGMIYNLQVKAPTKEGICDVCTHKLIARDDDVPEVIQRRLKIYHDQTEELVTYYRERNIYHAVNGEGKVDEVFFQVATILDRLLGDFLEKEAVR
jgi:adenylate kinase